MMMWRSVQMKKLRSSESSIKCQSKVRAFRDLWRPSKRLDSQSTLMIHLLFKKTSRLLLQFRVKDGLLHSLEEIWLVSLKLVLAKLSPTSCLGSFMWWLRTCSRYFRWVNSILAWRWSNRSCSRTNKRACDVDRHAVQKVCRLMQDKVFVYLWRGP